MYTYVKNLVCWLGGSYEYELCVRKSLQIERDMFSGNCAKRYPTSANNSAFPPRKTWCTEFMCLNLPASGCRCVNTAVGISGPVHRVSRDDTLKRERKWL